MKAAGRSTDVEQPFMAKCCIDQETQQQLLSLANCTFHFQMRLLLPHKKMTLISLLNNREIKSRSSDDKRVMHSYCQVLPYLSMQKLVLQIRKHSQQLLLFANCTFHLTSALVKVTWSCRAFYCPLTALCCKSSLVPCVQLVL